MTSCQEKGSTRIIKGVSERRHRYRRQLSDATRCELYIQQTLRNRTPSRSRSPMFPKFARRGRSCVSCLLSAQFELTSSSGILRRALHRFDKISRATRPCLRRVKWKGGSQKDRVTGREMGQRERKKKKEERR